jgi:hypothetical protein
MQQKRTQQNHTNASTPAPRQAPSINSTPDGYAIVGTSVIVHIPVNDTRHSAPGALHITVVLSRTTLPITCSVNMNLARDAMVAQEPTRQNGHGILLIVDMREMEIGEQIGKSLVSYLRCVRELSRIVRPRKQKGYALAERRIQSL